MGVACSRRRVSRHGSPQMLWRPLTPYDVEEASVCATGGRPKAVPVESSGNLQCPPSPQHANAMNPHGFPITSTFDGYQRPLHALPDSDKTPAFVGAFSTITADLMRSSRAPLQQPASLSKVWRRRILPQTGHSVADSARRSRAAPPPRWAASILLR